MTLNEYITKHGFGFSSRMVDERKDGLMNDSSRHFRCRISNGRRSFGFYFSQGSAHTENPTLADVLNCMADDSAGYENARQFETWATDYGYDADSRQAEKVFRAVKRQAEQLKRTIGQDAYGELLWNTDRF